MIYFNQKSVGLGFQLRQSIVKWCNQLKSVSDISLQAVLKSACYDDLHINQFILCENKVVFWVYKAVFTRQMWMHTEIGKATR